MRRIIHMSDLHFGRIRPELIAPLTRAVAEIAPDLVVISGDLTQRARRRQFRAARDFIRDLPAPVLTVPGNHDVPLDNLATRFFRPFSRYRRIVDRVLEPVWADDELNVVGVNTVNPFAWQSGLIRSRAVRRVCSHFSGPAARCRIVVLHHPLNHAPGTPKRLMRGARKAAEGLADCGADIVLSGHLHSTRTHVWEAASGDASVLLIEAGTGLSSRLRGRNNDFNLLEIDGPELRVVRFDAADHGDGPPRFAAGDEARFRREGRRWHRLGTDPIADPRQAPSGGPVKRSP